MSSAAVASASYGDERVASGSGSKRRSLFKPSTWKSGKATQPQSQEEEDAVHGQHHHRALQTLDGAETGAPLTALVSAEEEDEGQRTTRKEVDTSPQPTTAAAGGSDEAQPAHPSSGLPTIPDAHGRITFFRQDQPNFHLSNSSLAYPVYFNSTLYPSAEHLFQSLKFLPSHASIAAKVRRAKTPLDAMRIARSHTSLYNPGWISAGVNVRVMHQVVLAKFSQYSALTDTLLETDEREIVNASPTDVFWGEGGGRGRNVLGKTLMDVREVLRVNRGVGWGSGAKTM